jgi:ubiquitin carboxyl-terminal hydrolase 14
VDFKIFDSKLNCLFLHILTVGVPIDRQKLMCKAWKGILKEDSQLSGINQDEIQIVTLMGSAELAVKPVEKITFEEDVPFSERVKNSANYLPTGLVNVGNTCYLNSPLEVIRFMPEIKEAIVDHKKALSVDRGSPYSSLADELADTMVLMDSKGSATAPNSFIAKLRRLFPQFGETGSRGEFKQQDSEEFFSTLLTALSSTLKNSNSKKPSLPLLHASNASPNVIDSYFGIEFDVQHECKETKEVSSMKSSEFQRKLSCHIDGGAGRPIQINHMADGIRYSLSSEIEKFSETLQANAKWTVSSKISRLPKYLTVQLMRFYWKATPESQDHRGIKCKMLRPINFPSKFDVFEFCNDQVKSVLKTSRDKHELTLADSLNSNAKKQKVDASTAVTPASSAPAPAPAPAPAAAEAEDDPELAAALKLSLGEASSEPTSSSIGYDLPESFRGIYELSAIVTHKGRSADSGHYMGWIRQSGDKWLVFDDDDVSESTTEYVTATLKGGGDDHMAYLLFYRALE